MTIYFAFDILSELLDYVNLKHKYITFTPLLGEVVFTRTIRKA